MDDIQAGEVLILNCPACQFMTLRIKSLEEHIVTHPLQLTVVLYKCVGCGLCSTSESVMKEHVDDVHTHMNCDLKKIAEKIYNEDKPLVLGKDLSCDFCAFKSKSMVEMQDHINASHDFLSNVYVAGNSCMVGQQVTSGPPGAYPVRSLLPAAQLGLNEMYGKTSGLEASQIPDVNLLQLISMTPHPVEINLPGNYLLDKTNDGVVARIKFMPNFLSKGVADQLLETLRKELPWKVPIYCSKTGETRRVPHMSYYSGPTYEYAGIRHPGTELDKWHPKLLELKALVEKATDCRFNSVLGILYRHGNDSIGWHSDDEKELGDHPAIASVSFGQNRWFEFNRKGRPDRMIRVFLRHGDLMLTDGAIQDLWKHRVPKDQYARRCRVNFTFRVVKPFSPAQSVSTGGGSPIEKTVESKHQEDTACSANNVKILAGGPSSSEVNSSSSSGSGICKSESTTKSKSVTPINSAKKARSNGASQGENHQQRFD